MLRSTSSSLNLDSCCLSRNTCQRDVSSTHVSKRRVFHGFHDGLTNTSKHLSQSSRLPLIARDMLFYKQAQAIKLME